MDSKKDLTSSVNHVRSTFRIWPHCTEDEISSFIGDGAQMLIQRALGADADRRRTCIPDCSFFFPITESTCWTKAFSTPALTKRLKRLSDFRLAVLTNKPIRFSRTMLEGLGISGSLCRGVRWKQFRKKEAGPVGILQILTDTHGQPREHVDDRRFCGRCADR